MKNRNRHRHFAEISIYQTLPHLFSNQAWEKMNIILRTKHYLRFLPVMGFLLMYGCLAGQDIHFSQYYNAPLNLSPALTGISSGDVRIGGIYRSQWNAANSPYKTILASGEYRFYTMAHPDWWFSGGLMVFYDRAGDSKLETTNVSLSGSYTKMLSKGNFLTLGVAAGFGQRSFDFAKLTFDEQWNGDVFDPNRIITEDFNNTNISYPDFGAGVNYRGQNPKYSAKPRSKVDLGAGVYHLFQPEQNFNSSDQSKLPFRLGVYFLPTLQLNQKADLIGNLTYQVQGKSAEALAGVAYRHHLSTKKAKELALQFGVGFRFNAIGDALIPSAELHYRDMIAAISWDINVSDFSAATNRNGGPELSFRYIIKKVYPLRAFKACPLI